MPINYKKLLFCPIWYMISDGFGGATRRGVHPVISQTTIIYY